MSRISRASCAAGAVTSGDTRTDDGNPLLENVPPVPTLPEAMRLTERQEQQDVTGWNVQELIAHESADAFVTDATHAGVLVDVVSQVRSSYRDRDLRDCRYRNHAIEANRLLHSGRPGPSVSIPSRFGVAPMARPRGIVVVAPVGTGRRRLADMVASALGSEPRVARISAAAGVTEYLQLPVLRIPWPIDGRQAGLAQAFIGAFDAVFRTSYAIATRTPLFRERDIVPTICALAVASSLGLLVVERINMQDATNPAAESTWNALGQFTRVTGVPVLCQPTPGAAAAGLTRLPGVAAELTSAGFAEITPSCNSREKHWIAVCVVLFNRTIRVAGVASMPSWLPDAAYDLTLGYPGPLARALCAIAQNMVRLNVRVFTLEIFAKYGRLALALDQYHLDAVRIIRQGGTYTPSTLMRHGDWLSLHQLASARLMPELR
ncbi:hypothetical protein WJ542_21325 [Paraburkholderia sp. B3]|uniref:hypothetical protein n=1 Tax=Paraburkholderia sp. B3 TaxID=3134791 RepID=UPI003982CC8B